MAEPPFPGAAPPLCGGNAPEGGMRLFEEERPAFLTDEQERLKRAMYERMRPGRRKFVDRIGYDVWNPFQEPKEPLDLRRDRTRRTLQELVQDFLKESGDKGKDQAWRQGAMDCALGIIKKDERYQGIFDFCLWYASILEKEGQLRED